MDELNRLSVAEFKNVPKFPYCLILDDIRSLNNVGSVFRTADAFRAEKLYLCGITGTPPHRDIAKTALGATESVVWEHVADCAALVRHLQQTGWIVAALEQVESSVMLHNFQPDPDRKYAFVMGNEVTGVQETVIHQADLTLEIPQFGTKHSLNVAVSTGVLCWHYLEKITKT